MPHLRMYQLEGVKEILDKKKVIIADDMSLGKSAEAIASKIIIEKHLGYDSNTLIVCPASVVEVWESEIKKWYKKKNKTKITKIQSNSYDFDIKKAQNSDFTIIGYPTLSYFRDQKKHINKLQTLKCNYGIIDEGHNAKNPDSIRSMAVKKLFDSMNYLAILSGTPVPDTVPDIYMLLSLLDKESFPINIENSRSILTSFYASFRRDPGFIRNILNDRMLRRTIEDGYLSAEFPEIYQNDLEIKLKGQHQEVYLQIYNNDNIKPGAKLWQLIKASIDPNLVNPELLDKKLASRIGRIKSSVYTTLDDFIEEIVDNNGKVLMFSDLKENVTHKLKERWGKYGAINIDADVPSTAYNSNISVREETRRKFQKDPDCKVLISTTVMDEGVDLTAATETIHLTLPYTPKTFKQRNRRSQRIGEVKKDFVNIHIVKPKLDLIPVITEGIERLLIDKQRIIDYLLKQPFNLTIEDLNEIKNGGIRKSKHIPPLNPIKSVISHLGQLKGQGYDKILSHYKKYPEEAEYMARLYASYWDGYYSGNTANLYTKVIKILEKKENLERKLDLGSGPFSLSRRLKEPIINIDLNNHMLNAGKILESKKKIVSKNKAIQTSFHQLPFRDNSFDLAVCSLALHMSKLNIKKKREDINERELVLRETNRVLRNGGYSLITLPHTIIAEYNFPKFYQGLKELGFKVLPFSGFYKAKDSNFNVYLAGLKKVGEPCEKPLKENLLSWKMDTQLRRNNRKSKNKRKHSMPEEKKVKKEFLNEFYHTRKRKGLEESVIESIKYV